MQAPLLAKWKPQMWEPLPPMLAGFGCCLEIFSGKVNKIFQNNKCVHWSWDLWCSSSSNDKVLANAQYLSRSRISQSGLQESKGSWKGGEEAVAGWGGLNTSLSYRSDFNPVCQLNANKTQRQIHKTQDILISAGTGVGTGSSEGKRAGDR